MYCTECGNKVLENSKFCSTCGNSLNSPIYNNLKRDNDVDSKTFTTRFPITTHDSWWTPSARR